MQYFVLESKEYEAFYKLQNAESQITSYVFDVVRARVPKMILDRLFDKKDEIKFVIVSTSRQDRTIRGLRSPANPAKARGRARCARIQMRGSGTHAVRFQIGRGS